jgi:hypothetical protein
VKVLYFFFNFPYDFSIFKNILQDFFNSRGISFSFNTSSLSNFVFQNLNFFFLDFLRSDFYITYSVQNIELQYYKLKLKLLLKTSYNKEMILVLFIVNSEIMKWLEYTFSFRYKEKVYVQLDLYVYKLFWRHLKKRHPKKSSTWIYLRYWGNFSGLWKFFVFNYKTNKFIFLKSHISLFSYSVINNYKIYNFLNVYNLYNSIKLNQLLLKKFEFRDFPTYTVLYEKQKGLCFICRKPLSLKNFRVLYLKKKEENLFKNLIIVHSYCRFKRYTKYI